MASGLGTRFGGNKLMADFNGEPMICQILSATDELFSRRIVVTRHEDIADLCRNRGIHVILHDLPYRSDTVRLGLEALAGIQLCMFCPGDQPLLQRKTIERLLQSALYDKAAIWRPEHDGSPGSPVLFPQWSFSELLTLPTGKGGGYIIQKYPEQVRTIPVRDPYELMDADTPQAYDLLLEAARLHR